MKTNNNIKIQLDNTFFYIESKEETFKCLHQHEFKDCINILLTNKQYEDYICEDIRKFDVNQKKLEKIKEYLSDNIWRKNK